MLQVAVVVPLPPLLVLPLQLLPPLLVVVRSHSCSSQCCSGPPLHLHSILHACHTPSALVLAPWLSFLITSSLIVLPHPHPVRTPWHSLGSCSCSLVIVCDCHPPCLCLLALCLCYLALTYASWPSFLLVFMAILIPV